MKLRDMAEIEGFRRLSGREIVQNGMDAWWASKTTQRLSSQLRTAQNSAGVWGGGGGQPPPICKHNARMVSVNKNVERACWGGQGSW